VRAAWLLALVLTAGAAQAEPLIDLQRAVTKAEAAADARAQALNRAKRDVLGALAIKGNAAGNTIALAAAEQREQAASIGALQSITALRRARQALTEAVTDAVEQGEAIERAAARAAHGDVAPSVSDLLACDGPDCVAIPVREHTALVLMGAVGASFDPTKWSPPEHAITALPYLPAALPLRTLRTAADDARRTAQAAQAVMIQSRTDVQSGVPDTMTTYARARVAADAAQATRAAAEATLEQTLRGYADAGRALKRAALLAGDGYSLQRGGRRVCAGDDCIAAQGLEAAAFLVLGAAADMNEGRRTLKDFVIPAADGGFVFR
jgi:hypothetical protein